MSEDWTDEQEQQDNKEIRSAGSMIDMYAMFPEAAKRVEILKELKHVWPQMVRNLWKFSEPYCLGVNELYICVTNPRAEVPLMRMKGNILREMSARWGYEPLGEFSLRITDKREKYKKLVVKKPEKKIIPKIEVSEEKVKEYMQGAPETLPEDINYAISHLRVFLDELNRKGLTPRLNLP